MRARDLFVAAILSEGLSSATRRVSDFFTFRLRYPGMKRDSSVTGEEVGAQRADGDLGMTVR